MTITESDWLARLPEAVAPHRLVLGEHRARIEFDARAHGLLELTWAVLPERRIALIRLAQLRVGFHFVGPSQAHREAFMRRFDLYLQRGGG